MTCQVGYLGESLYKGHRHDLSNNNAHLHITET